MAATAKTHELREFRGNNYHAIFNCRQPEVLLCGPAGTGKSLAILTKLHLLCHPEVAAAAGLPSGIRCLMVRKTRRSLTDAALVTFEEKVNVGRLAVDFGKIKREQRHSYRYPNGSEIVLAGMDDPAKVMSTDFDIVYVQEAVELDEEDWDALSSRIRNGVLPYQQLIADTNPSYPQHWLKRRCDAGRVILLNTTHRDNPAFYTRPKVKHHPDGRVEVLPGVPTERGKKYLERLDNLTGPRRDRLRDGRWVQAEGMVYEEWNESVNVIDRRPIPRDWTRYLSIDFGFNDPFVCQWWVLDEDGRAILYREIVRTGTLVEDMAKDILRWNKVDRANPLKVFCDHDAEPRAVLEKHLGRLVTPAYKDIEAGIQLVGARIRQQADGKPRLMVMRDSLIERDERMIERGVPIGFIEEVGGYCWTDKIRKEIPQEKDNHSMDAARMFVATLDRPGAKMAFRLIG